MFVLPRRVRKFHLCFFRRTECGQSASTSLACLKILRPISQKATHVFAYKDSTFPRDPHGSPDANVIARVNASVAELSDAYRGTGKRSQQETFQRKMAEVPAVGLVAALSRLAGTMAAELDGRLSFLEAAAGTAGEFVVSGRNIVDGRRTNLEVNHLRPLVTYRISFRNK